MTQILRLIQAELVSRTRDKSFWLEAVLLPVVVTVIMGLALGRVGHGKTPLVQIGVVASSDNLLTVQVLREAYKTTGTLEMLFFTSIDEARARLKDRQLDTVVLVTDVDPVTSESPVTVTVEAGRTTQFQATMVAQVTEATLRTMMVEIHARRTLADLLVQSQRDPTPAWTTPAPIPVSAKLEQVSLQRFDALGAQFSGLAIFFSLLSAFRLMVNIFGQHRQGLNLRLAGAPVAPVILALGFVATVASVASVQTLTVLIVGRFAFGVAWGAPAILVLAILLASTASAAVALTLAVLPMSASSRGLVGTLVVLGGSVLGGSLVPIESASPTLQFLAKATLHYWVTGLFTGLSRGLHASDVGQLFIGVTVYGAVASALAAAFLARRRPGRA